MLDVEPGEDVFEVFSLWAQQWLEDYDKAQIVDEDWQEFDVE